MSGDTIYISGIGVHIPETRIDAAELLDRDRDRVSELAGCFRFAQAFRDFSGFGIREVPESTDLSPVDLAMSASRKALSEAAIPAESLDLIVDFSTVPYRGGSSCPVLQGRLNAMNACAVGLSSGGCASVILAVEIAVNYFSTDPEISRALLFAGDRVPSRSRVCFPLSILGDGGSAVVLSRERGLFRILSTAVMTNGKLAAAVGLPGVANEPIPVDIPMFETHLLPVHYKACSDVINKALRRASLTREDIAATIYPNMSVMDREGFRRAFPALASGLVHGPLTTTGHVFASDMIINLAALMKSGIPASGANILLVSSGAGFYWGACVLRVTGMG